MIKAWGSGDEKVVAKIVSCFSTPGGVKIRQGILSSPGVGKAKGPLGGGSQGLSSRSSGPPSPKVSLRLGRSTQ